MVCLIWRVTKLILLWYAFCFAVLYFFEADHYGIDDERSAVIVARLVSDVHISIANHTLVLPFAALENYAYRRYTFSFDRKGEQKRAANDADKLLRDAEDPNNPWVLEALSVVVQDYGHAIESYRKQICARLRREWARSVCDNYHAAIRQALPANRFRLVDLRSPAVTDPSGPDRCAETQTAPLTIPGSQGEASIVCEAAVSSTQTDFYRAVVRIDGNLGAQWMVWGGGNKKETAEAMTKREGQAIVAFVRYALGANEDFSKLLETMCRLRRPGPFSPSAHSGCPGESVPTTEQ